MRFTSLPLAPYLSALTEEQEGAAISIYLPTHSSGPQTSQGRVHLKNAIRAAAQALESQDGGDADHRDLLDPAIALVDDPDFWQHQRDGLALFLSREIAYHLRLPYAAPFRAVVDRTFLVRPLIPMLMRAFECVVIALSQRRVRVFRATPDDFTELDLSGWPESLRDLSAVIDVERTLQSHTSGGAQGGAGRRAATFHGQGADDAQYKTRIFEFFRQLDEPLNALLAETQGPLVPFGVDRVVRVFREACTCRQLSTLTVEGNPDHLSPTEVFARVRGTIDSLVDDQRCEGMRHFEAAKNEDRATTDFERIDRAARFGQIETLIVEPFGTQPNRGQTSESTESLSCDRLDDLVRRALQTSTSVYPARNDGRLAGARTRTLSIPLVSRDKTIMDDSPQNIPPGWDYNPATWSQRLPIVGLALAGAAIAGYLTMWQYDLIESVWEPFFGDGTREILDSELSYVLPISDAALGFLAYLGDAVAGVIGGRGRWRTMPWIVVVFAILVGPLGAISIGLVIAQPVMYGEWCTLCLASAVVSIVMVAPAMDEALASLQYLKRVYHSPDYRFWTVFWGLHRGERIIAP